MTKKKVGTVVTVVTAATVVTVSKVVTEVYFFFILQKCAAKNFTKIFLLQNIYGPNF